MSIAYKAVPARGRRAVTPDERRPARTARLRCAGAGILLAPAVLTVGGCSGTRAAEPDAATSAPTTAAAASANAASTALPQGGERVDLDPAAFTADITHPYWPMTVGDSWTSEEIGGGSTQRVEITVLDQTRTVAAGVEARVVHDKVTEGGKLVEDTYDWYAQDAAGNVWYVGEDTTEYEDGRPASTAGSWEAGVAGAQPGILLPAAPSPGLAYRQEYLAGEAEDTAAVLSVTEQLATPTGRYEGVLMTRETTRLEPDVVELKLYARDVGPVLAVQISGGTSRETLLKSTRAR